MLVIAKNTDKNKVEMVSKPFVLKKGEVYDGEGAALWAEKVLARPSIALVVSGLLQSGLVTDENAMQFGAILNRAEQAITRTNMSWKIWNGMRRDFAEDGKVTVNHHSKSKYILRGAHYGFAKRIWRYMQVSLEKAGMELLDHPLFSDENMERVAGAFPVQFEKAD